jgi:hypothetical protein
MPPRIGTLASAGIPSKLTVGEGMAALAGPRPLRDWTAASPLKPRPAAAGPRSGRSRLPVARLAAVAACLATSRMAGEVSNATALVNLGFGPAWAASGAPWAVPTGAETTRPVTSSNGTSHRARPIRIRSPTVGPPSLATSRT